MDCQLIRSGLSDLSPGYYRSPGVHASTLLSALALRFGHYERDKQGRPISDLNRELGNTLEHSIAQRAEQKHPGTYLHNPEILCDGVYITPDLVTLQDVEMEEGKGGERFSWSIKLTRMSPARLPDTDVKMWRFREQLKAELYALRRVQEGSAQIRLPIVIPLREEIYRCAGCGGYMSKEELTRDGTGHVWPNLERCGPVHLKYGDGESLQWHSLSSVGDRVGDLYLTGYLTVLFINDYRPPEEQCPTWRFKFFPEELAMTWGMLMQEKERQEADNRG